MDLFLAYSTIPLLLEKLSTVFKAAADDKNVPRNVTTVFDPLNLPPTKPPLKTKVN